MIFSPNGDADFFGIVPEVSQGNILEPFVFMLYGDEIPRTSINLIKENCLTLKPSSSYIPQKLGRT